MKAGKTRPLSDAEEAVIQTEIAANEDAAEASDADLAAAVPFAEAFPDLMASIKRARGRPKSDRPRRQISLRLDADVIEKFKATGKGWQSRINEALRSAKV